MYFGIPGTNIGVDLDIPDPAQFARDMLGKAQAMLDNIRNAILGFAKSAATKIGEGTRGIFTSMPGQLLSGLKEAIQALWNALRGRS